MKTIGMVCFLYKEVGVICRWNSIAFCLYVVPWNWA